MLLKPLLRLFARILKEYGRRGKIAIVVLITLYTCLGLSIYSTSKFTKGPRDEPEWVQVLVTRPVLGQGVLFWKPRLLLDHPTLPEAMQRLPQRALGDNGPQWSGPTLPEAMRAGQVR